MKTREDICRLKFENWNDWKKSTRKIILDAMEEYASQPSDVSDEDILKWADSKERRLTSYHIGLQAGAKAMRDGKIKKGE